jgi:hypothetical protein
VLFRWVSAVTKATATATAHVDLRQLFPNLGFTDVRYHPEPPIIEQATPQWPLRNVTLSVPESPMVSAILVVGQQERVKLARRAVQVFVEQHYLRKQLIIINATPAPVTNVEWHEIKEVQVQPGPSLGILRNMGIDRADGEWIIGWDDDDWSHPYRLAYQMAHRREGMACLLTYQLRCDVDRSTAFLYHRAAGIPSTMLFPKTLARYPDLAVAEDLAFWVNNWGYGQHILINNETARFPASVMSIAFYHGRNVTSELQFMEDHTDAAFDGKWILAAEEVEHLRSVLTEYGFKINATESSEPVAVPLASSVLATIKESP